MVLIQGVEKLIGVLFEQIRKAPIGPKGVDKNKQAVILQCK